MFQKAVGEKHRLVLVACLNCAHVPTTRKGPLRHRPENHSSPYVLLQTRSHNFMWINWHSQQPPHALPDHFAVHHPMISSWEQRVKESSGGWERVGIPHPFWTGWHSPALRLSTRTVVRKKPPKPSRVVLLQRLPKERGSYVCAPRGAAITQPP